MSVLLKLFKTMHIKIAPKISLSIVYRIIIENLFDITTKFQLYFFDGRWRCKLKFEKYLFKKKLFVYFVVGEKKIK